MRTSKPGKVDELLLLLQGGLGNQLMQLVLAESLAKALGLKPIASYVLLESRSRKLRGLTKRSISSLIENQLIVKPVPWHRHIAPRIAARLGDLSGGYVLTDDLLIKAAGRDLHLEELSKTRVIHSHATHPILFESEFAASWQLILDSLQNYWSGIPVKIAMHVRRRDYINPSSGFILLTEAYYKAALSEALEALLTALTPTVVHIFSDDPDWCLNHLQDPRWQLVINQSTPEQDLASMIHSEVVITGNSSFSAIAGHLAQLVNPSTLVLTPQHWLLKPAGRLGELRKANWQVVNS